MLERDVVLCSKENGQDTIDLPITRLGNIEDSAEVKTAPESGDYIPVVDTADGGQMKKVPWDDIKMAAGGIPIVTTYTPEGGTEGVDYAVDIPGVDAPYAGLLVCVIAHVASLSDTLTLTCAGIKRSIKRPATTAMAAALQITGAALKGTRLFTKNRPCLLMNNGNVWLAVSHTTAQLDAVIGTLDVAHGGTGGAVAEVARENLGAAAKSTAIAATLTAAGWAGSGPFTQTLSVTGLAADGNGSIGLAQTATAAQREAARDAMLSVTAQAAGTLTVTADGDKPTVDIPVSVVLIG